MCGCVDQMNCVFQWQTATAVLSVCVCEYHFCSVVVLVVVVYLDLLYVYRIIIISEMEIKLLCEFTIVNGTLDTIYKSCMWVMYAHRKLCGILIINEWMRLNLISLDIICLWTLSSGFWQWNAHTILIIESLLSLKCDVFPVYCFKVVFFLRWSNIRS